MTRREMQMVERVQDGWHVGYAYLYPINGSRKKEFVFDMLPENIASFIYRNQHEARKIEITDMRDRLIFRIDTNGNSNCRDRDFCRQIARALQAIVDGSEPAEFAIVTRRVYDEYCRLEEKAVMDATIAALLKEAQGG